MAKGYGVIWEKGLKKALIKSSKMDTIFGTKKEAQDLVKEVYRINPKLKAQLKEKRYAGLKLKIRSF